MEEFVISHSEKGFLSERDSSRRKIAEGWSRIFRGCSKDEAVLLENIISHVTLNETNMSSDIGGYDGFILSMVRRVFGNMISKELVSVQPIMGPTGRVFYLDPKVTTGTSADFQSMVDSHYGNTNYDVSKGRYALLSGGQTTLAAANYNSGATFNIPYSGGVDGLTSLKVYGLQAAAGAIYSAYPASGPKDYDGTGATSTNIGAKYSVDGSGVPVDYYHAHAILDTSPLVGKTVTAMTLGFRSESYTRTGTDAVDCNVYLWDGSGYNVHAYRQTTATNLAGRNITTALTTNAQFACVNASGGTMTAVEFRVTVPITNPGANQWSIRAYEGAVGQTGATRLVVSYTSGTKQEELKYAISPTTWAVNLFSGNQLNIMATQTGSTMAGSMNAFAEWRSYSGLESQSGMQTVQLNVVSDQVSVTSRKLKAKFTDEMMQDLQSYFNMDVLAEMGELIGMEIAAEIDREIIGSLIKIAPYRSEWYYDMYALSSTTALGSFYSGDQRDIVGMDLSAVTAFQWARDSLLTAINKMDGQIRKANIYHGANWLVCSTKVGTVIETMPEHEAVYGSTVMDVNRIHRTGRLKGRIGVYVDPYLPDNICLLGYNASNWDAGFIYAPYIMSEIHSIRTPEDLFVQDMDIMARYATKVVTNKKYGLIDCKFPADYTVVNGD